MLVKYAQTSAAVIASTFLSFASASQAATIGVSPGEWTRFTFPRVGQPALDAFTFNASPTGAILYVTDAGLSGDRFSVSVNGTSVGTTSPASRGSSCGFDPKNCFTSSLMSNGTFVLKDSGEQNIDITTTASAVSGIGGVGFLRADTTFINLYGNVGARADFISILNGASKGVRFYEDQLDPTSSFTQLFADVIDRSNFNPFGDLLDQVTSGVGPYAPSKPVNLLLGYNLPSVLGGAQFDTFQAIDLEDIKKLPTGNSLSDSPTSVIAHEVAEASLIASGLLFEQAHPIAIGAQNLVLKDETGGQRALQIGNRSLPLGIILNNLYTKGDLKPESALLQGGELRDYSSLDTLFYRNSDTEGWMLFPWTDSTGKAGWSIWIATGPKDQLWSFADLRSGMFDTGVPWSGRDVDISLDSVRFETVPDSPTSVPTPALLPGLAGMGIAALRRKFAQSKNLEA
jgi:hypothetical protein